MGRSCDFKESLTRDCRLQVFFTNQFFPCPWVSCWGYFEFVRKFVEIFATLWTPAISCSLVSATPAILSAVLWSRNFFLRLQLLLQLCGLQIRFADFGPGSRRQFNFGFSVLGSRSTTLIIASVVVTGDKVILARRKNYSVLPKIFLFFTLT